MAAAHEHHHVVQPQFVDKVAQLIGLFAVTVQPQSPIGVTTNDCGERVQQQVITFDAFKSAGRHDDAAVAGGGRQGGGRHRVRDVPDPVGDAGHALSVVLGVGGRYGGDRIKPTIGPIQPSGQPTPVLVKEKVFLGDTDGRTRSVFGEEDVETRSGSDDDVGVAAA